MNLVELIDLIKSIPKDDTEMVEYYTGKKKELIADINASLKEKNLGPFTENELVAIQKKELAANG